MMNFLFGVYVTIAALVFAVFMVLVDEATPPWAAVRAVLWPLVLVYTLIVGE